MNPVKGIGVGVGFFKSVYKIGHLQLLSVLFILATFSGKGRIRATAQSGLCRNCPGSGSAQESTHGIKESG